MALLMVFLYHAWLCAGEPSRGWWNAGSGYIGVNLFLTLSGFCLYWPLVKGGQHRNEPTLLQFAFRRARRILPPYYAAVALFTVTALIMAARDPQWSSQHNASASEVLRQFGWHLLMIHNLRPDYIFTLAGPFWSLALEVELYVAMPILVIVARRSTIVWAVSLAAVVSLGYRSLLDHSVGGEGTWAQMGNTYGFALCYFLPGRWLEFALGMWAATLVANGSPRLARLPFLFFAAVLVSAGIVLSRRYGQLMPLSDPLFGLGFFSLIVGVSQPSRSILSQLVVGMLRSRPLVWLGTISYSVYLLHNPLLNFMAGAVRSHLGSALGMMALCLGLFLPIIVAASWVFYLFVEKPFLAKPVPGKGIFVLSRMIPKV